MSKKYMGSDKGLIKLIELIKTHFEQLSCDDLKSVSTEASQRLTDTEKANARNNIGALATNGDSKSNTVTFTSNDVDDANATSWTSVPKLTSGITHKTFLERVSQMFKNVRYLYKMLGTTDISKIGDGTITGVISSLNSNFEVKSVEITNGNGVTLYARAYKLSKLLFVEGFLYNSTDNNTGILFTINDNIKDGIQFTTCKAGTNNAYNINVDINGAKCANMSLPEGYYPINFVLKLA